MKIDICVNTFWVIFYVLLALVLSIFIYSIASHYNKQDRLAVEMVIKAQVKPELAQCAFTTGSYGNDTTCVLAAGK